MLRFLFNNRSYLLVTVEAFSCLRCLPRVPNLLVRGYKRKMLRRLEKFHKQKAKAFARLKLKLPVTTSDVFVSRDKKAIAKLMFLIQYLLDSYMVSCFLI